MIVLVLQSYKLNSNSTSLITIIDLTQNLSNIILHGFIYLLLMTDSFDWLCSPLMIMSEHIGLKFRSYILLLNAGSESPILSGSMAYVQYYKVICRKIRMYKVLKVTRFILNMQNMTKYTVSELLMQTQDRQI